MCVFPSSAWDDVADCGITVFVYHPLDCIAMFGFYVRRAGKLMLIVFAKDPVSNVSSKL
ncbi:hypothetical protein EMIT0P218_10853 [Pseudomonas sp. IT-P218]